MTFLLIVIILNHLAYLSQETETRLEENVNINQSWIWDEFHTTQCIFSLYLCAVKSDIIHQKAIGFFKASHCSLVLSVAQINGNDEDTIIVMNLI